MRSASAIGRIAAAIGLLFGFALLGGGSAFLASGARFSAGDELAGSSASILAVAEATPAADSLSQASLPAATAVVELSPVEEPQTHVQTEALETPQKLDTEAHNPPALIETPPPPASARPPAEAAKPTATATPGAESTVAVPDPTPTGTTPDSEPSSTPTPAATP